MHSVSNLSGYRPVGHVVQFSDAQIMRAFSQHLGLKSLRESSQSSMVRTVLAMQRSIGGASFQRVTEDDLITWRLSLTVADCTKYVYIVHIRGFFGWAFENGWIATNPARVIPIPRCPETLPRPIGEQPLMRALATAPRQIRLWLVLAAWCGLRAGEIAGLTRECIMDDRDEPAILVRLSTTKGISERVVPMCPFVISEIHRYGLPSAGPVFLKDNGTQVTPNYVSLYSSKFFRGLTIKATIHMLRHRFATQLFRATRDIRLVQRALGHKSLATTMLYIAFFQEDVISGVALLPVPEDWRGLDAAA
jgi:integrase/recombinase XerC